MTKKKKYGKRGQKIGWHDYKYGDTFEIRLYSKTGKVKAIIPKKRKK